MIRNLPLLCAIGLCCLPLAWAFADSPEEQLAAASALYDAKKYAQAAQKLDTFLADNPKHPKAAAAAWVLGRCRSELGQYAQAIPAYEKVIAARDPQLTNLAELSLGEAAIHTSQFDKAATALDAAVKTQLKPQQAPVAWYWLAQADFKLQRYAPSEEAYEKVVHDYGKSDFVDDATYGAGLTALRQNKLDVARQHLRTVVDRYPNSVDRPEALLLVAQMDLQAKRYQDAHAEFQAFLQDPAAKAAGADSRSTAEDGLIQALLAEKNYAAAAPLLESAMNRLPASDPEHYRAALSLATIRYEQKQYQPALAAYQEAGKSSDEDVAARAAYWGANASLALGHTAEAAGQFSRFAARFPKNDLAPKALLRAGNAYLDAKQQDAAATAFRTVVDRYPQAPEAVEARKTQSAMVASITDPGLLAAALKNAPPEARVQGTLRLARLYLGAKKYAEASQTLTEFVKGNLDANTAGEAQYLLGIAYDAQQKSAPAALALAEAVRRSPTAKWAVDAQSRLAWLYLDQKQSANAEKAALAALDLKPDPQTEQQTRLALLQAQLNQKKWADVQDNCRALLAGNPDADTMPTVLYAQAFAGEQQGKHEDALPLWEKLADAYPKSTYAAEALLHVGNARFKAEKYDEAKEKYMLLLANFPQSAQAPEARFQLASALYNLKSYPEAATQFETVAADKMAGDFIPESLYWAGVSLDKADKKDEAIKYLDKLVSQYPNHARIKNAKIRLAALKAVSGTP